MPLSGAKVKSSECIARTGQVLKPTVIRYGPARTCSVCTTSTGSNAAAGSAVASNNPTGTSSSSNG
jgi:hypothetical protein